ncbi:hypothetical protein [Eisenbergiella sp.]
MGVSDFDVYGKYKFGKEEQFTHFCLVIEAFSTSDAMEKAKVIAKDVNWSHASEHKCEE